MFPNRIGLASSLVKFDELVKVARAINLQVSRDLGPVWNIQATVEAVQDPKRIPTGVTPVFVVDDLPPTEGGVHKTDHNQPYALVETGPTWSLSASHECMEMLIDSSGDRLWPSSAVAVVDNEVHEAPGRFEYLVEVCDPSEAPANAYMIDDVLVSDFYTPHYFDPVVSQGVRYSFTGKITRPRQVLPDGYLSWFNPDTNTVQQLRCFGAPQIIDLGPAPANFGGRSMREFIDALTRTPVRLSALKPSDPNLQWQAKRAKELAKSSAARSALYHQHWRQLYAAAAAAAPVNAGDPSRVMKKNLKEMKAPGVISLRPGYLWAQGWITDQRAIVVTVHPEKEDSVRGKLPSKLDGVPIDVHPATPSQELRATDPSTYAALTAKRPEFRAAEFKDEIFVETPKLSDTLADAFEAAQGSKKDRIDPSAPEGVTLDAVEGDVTLLLHVSPEQGWANLQPFIESIKEKLVVGMYDFRSQHILAQVKASLANDQLTITLDDTRGRTGNPDPGNPTNVQTISALHAAIPPTKSAWALTRSDPFAEAYIYPTSYHIKVAVRDDGVFWLSSGNWNNANQPLIDLDDQAAALKIAKTSDRDWHVIVTSADLADVFRAYLEHDYTVASQNNVQPGTADLTAALGVDRLEDLGFEENDAPKARRFFPPKIVTDTIKIQPLLTPDNYQPHVLDLIKSATKTFYMQTQYIHWSDSPGDQKHRDLIDAIQDRITMGVDVKLITSQYETQDLVEKLKDAGLDTSVLRIQPHVHNKGIVVDSVVAMISSQNWSADGTLYNRDAGVIIWNAEVAAYFEEIFLHDWNNLSSTNIPPAPKKKSSRNSATASATKTAKTKSDRAKSATAEKGVTKKNSLAKPVRKRNK